MLQSMNELRSKIFESIEHLDNIKYLSNCEIEPSKLLGAYPEVREALAYYCPTSSFSDLIINQLAMIASHRCVELNGKLYPYIWSNLLNRMRLIEVNKPKYKPSKVKTPL
ncbi:hypothetical protein CRG86_013090 [Photobacterium leiognathi]|nr:hypothetical protein CRG86_013090 [Photobacterium leiognathi]